MISSVVLDKYLIIERGPTESVTTGKKGREKVFNSRKPLAETFFFHPHLSGVKLKKFATSCASECRRSFRLNVCGMLVEVFSITAESLHILLSSTTYK